MSIRAYTGNDLPSIIDIYNRSKLDELQFEDRKFTLLPLEEDIPRYSKLMESAIFIYSYQGQAAGFAAICGNEIRALFVHPDFRGKGVGAELIQFLLNSVPGIEVHLYVASSNRPAKTLYQKYGFSITDTFETTYNQEPVVAQKMVRRIVP